jgi:chromosome segregation ATPase
MEEKTTKDFEQEKLKLEIENLRKSWYKNFEFWKVVIPTIAILASLYFTFGKGIIDTQKEKLEIQKAQLKLEITQFEIRRGQIKEDVDIIEKELIRKEYQLKVLNRSLDSISNKVAFYKKELSSSKNRIEKISERSQKDKSFFLNQIKKEYDEKQEVIKNEEGYVTKISDLESDLKGFQAENRFLRQRVNLSKMDSLNLLQERLQAQSKSRSEEIKKLEKKRDNLKSNYESNKRSINTMTAEDLQRYFELRAAKSDYK